MNDDFRPPVRDPGKCEKCGTGKNAFLHDDGDRTIWCPNCDRVDLTALSDPNKYRCQGCDEVRTDCVAHHVSYDPEQVVPVCTECHGRLHADEAFLPELTPDMTRSEAENRDLVSIIGLDESWAVEEG